MFALAKMTGDDAKNQPDGITTFTSYTDYGGMIAWGEISLRTFYDENKALRNTWSRSNCDFDLARYFGTQLTLFPHPEIDYIVHYDVEYGENFRVEKKMCHPAFMINMPNSRICLSVKTRGFWKPVKLFMPRPAIFNSGWQFQNTWATRGLGMWAAAAIDLRYPWTPPTAPQTTNAATKNKAPRWWDNTKISTYSGKPAWAGGYWKYLDDGSPGAGGSHNIDYSLAKDGPFVVKHYETSLNILMTYKSYWQWGGDWAKPAVVCDPEQNRNTDVLNPQAIIGPHDLDKWGLLTERALRRITKRSPTPTRKAGRAFSGFQSSTSEYEEEEGEGDSDSFESLEEAGAMETEQENQSAQMGRRARREQHRRRVGLEQLLRLLKIKARQQK